MKLSIARALKCLLCVTALTAFDANAQQDYAWRLRMADTVQPAGPAPFGENISLYTGELGFLQTDVQLQGNGPDIVLARDFSTGGIPTFRDWALSIPRIEVIVKAESRFKLGQPGDNWAVSTYPDGTTLVKSHARCTDFNQPYDEYEDQITWWAGGYKFTTDRGEKQVLLSRSPQFQAAPEMRKPDGSLYTFPIVTQQNWQIGCLSNTSNGQVGEGFLAVSPDGTRYFLDHLVGIRTTDVTEFDPGGSRPVIHARMLATMYVSRIEDRFGNFVQYHYDNTQLTGITASDGRSVSLRWEATEPARIVEITVPGAPQRAWHYEYGEYGLTNVVLPDGSRWVIDKTSAPRPAAISGNLCTTRTASPPTAATATFTIQAPSGLVGQFALAPGFHARSYVPSGCRMLGASQTEDNFPLFGTGSVVSKTLSGPGIAAQTWRYAYSIPVGSTTHDACAQPGTCPDSRWVDVTDPGGDRTRYTLSTRWGPLEGKTLSVETFEGHDALVRTESTQYAHHDAGPWPATLGQAIDDYEANLTKNQTWSPVSRTTILQDGARFESIVTEFDAWARPVRTVRSREQ